MKTITKKKNESTLVTPAHTPCNKHSIEEACVCKHQLHYT